MQQDLAQPRRNIAAVCSLACLAAQLVWVGLCYAFVAMSDPGHWLAGVAGVLGAVVGVCVLSTVGMGLGFVGRRSGWGLLALVLNAGLFLLTAFLLLRFVGPLR